MLRKIGKQKNVDSVSTPALYVCYLSLLIALLFFPPTSLAAEQHGWTSYTHRGVYFEIPKDWDFLDDYMSSDFGSSAIYGISKDGYDHARVTFNEYNSVVAESLGRSQKEYEDAPRSISPMKEAVRKFDPWPPWSLTDPPESITVTFTSSGVTTIAGRKAFYLTFARDAMFSLQQQQQGLPPYFRDTHKLAWTANPWQFFSLHLQSSPEHFAEAQGVFDHMLWSIRLYASVPFYCHEVYYDCKSGYGISLHNPSEWTSYGLSDTGERVGPLRVLDSYQHRAGNMQMDVALGRVGRRHVEERISRRIESRPWLRDIDNSAAADLGCLPTPCPRFQKVKTKTQIEYQRIGPWLFAFIFTYRDDAKNAPTVFQEILDSLQFNPELAKRK